MTPDQHAHSRGGKERAAAGLVLRRAKPADAEAIARLSSLPGVRNGTLRLPFEDPERLRRRLENSGAGALPVIAEDDGEIIAHAGLHRFEGRRGHVATMGIFVHDDHVGRGIGTLMTAALIEAADRWLAIRRIELTVFADNAAAIALYTRFGFEQEGLLHDYAFRNGRYVDAIAMARLAPPL